MMRLTNIAHWVVRLTGPTLVVLGLLFWTGRALSLLQVHMLLGMVFVLALWALAGLAAWAGLHWALALLAVAWGLVVPVFGMAQTRLLPGPAHWVVKAVHLLIGMLAMVAANRLVRFIHSSPRRDRALVAESALGGR